MPQRATIALLLCGLMFLTACYEERTEITIREDGTVLLEQQLLIPERLRTALEEQGPEKTHHRMLELHYTEADIRRIVAAVDGTVEQVESRVIGGDAQLTLRAEFPSLEALNASGLGQQTGSPEIQFDLVSLIFSPAGNEPAPSCTFQSRVGFPISNVKTSLEQFYSLAQGGYWRRTVHFPVAVGDTNGLVTNNGQTVTWELDLRDETGLEEARSQYGPGGHITAYASLAADFAEPLMALAESKGEPQKELHITTAPLSGYRVRPDELFWHRIVNLVNPSPEANLSRVTIKMEVEWPRGAAPMALRTPRLIEARDNLGNVYSPPAESGAFYMMEFDEAVPSYFIVIPDVDRRAERLEYLEGDVFFVLKHHVEQVTVPNFQQWVGKEKMGNPILDERNIQIESLSPRYVRLQRPGNTLGIVKSLRLRRQGRWHNSDTYGMKDNAHNFRFEFDPEEADTLQIDLYVADNSLRVPFRFEDLRLPVRENTP